MVRVRDVMTTDVPKVSSLATVLEAANVMNKNKSSGVVVLDGEKVLGLISDRRLLTDFLPLNKRPDEVKVSDVAVPFYRIGPDEDAKIAAKEIVDRRITRLGVFDGERFLGWVTVADLSRYLSRKNLLDKLRSHSETEPSEILCPHCRRGFMEKVRNSDGQILRWQCPRCANVL